MSIKVVYDNIIKRISQVDSLDSMKQSIWNIFPELAGQEINVIYIKGVEKIVIPTDEEFKKVIEINKKFYIEKVKSGNVSQIEIQPNPFIKDNFAVFNSKCSTCGIFPITGEKYICIICEDLDLCPKCETTHNHPLIKLKTDEFQSSTDITNLIQTNKSLNTINQDENRQSIISVLKDKLIKPKYKAIVEMGSKFYIVKPNTEYTFQIMLYNEGEHSLPADTVVYVKNNKNFFIEMKKLNKIIFPGSMEYIDLKSKAGWVPGVYKFEAHLYNKEIKIEYTPLIFAVKINEERMEDIKEYETKPYSHEDTVSILPNEKKEVLCEIIRNEYSSKDIREICQILDKYEWKLSEEALNEIK
jgi:hypothetical protein